MTDAVEEIERLAGALIRQLSSGQRRTLMRRMATDLARSQRARIAAQLGPDGTPFEPRKPQPAVSGKIPPRGALRRKIMFRKLASARLLRAQADDRGFWVGFTGRTARIARVHQYGLRDRPSLRAREITYPRRELLGISDDDRTMMLDLAYNHIAEVLG